MEFVSLSSNRDNPEDTRIEMKMVGKEDEPDTDIFIQTFQTPPDKKKDPVYTVDKISLKGKQSTGSNIIIDASNLLRPSGKNDAFQPNQIFDVSMKPTNMQATYVHATPEI